MKTNEHITSHAIDWCGSLNSSLYLRAAQRYFYFDLDTQE